MGYSITPVALAVALFVTSVVLPLGSRASAVTEVQVDYSFTITSTFGGFPAPVTFTGVATFDLDAAPTFSGATFADYPLLSHTVSFDGTMLVAATNTSGAFQSQITIQDQVPFIPPKDRFQLFSSFNFQTSGIDVQFIGLTLEGPETIFSGVALFAPNLEDFTSPLGFVTFKTTEGNFANSVLLSSLTTIAREPTAVPEPGTLLLLGAGSAALAVARRRVTRPR